MIGARLAGGVTAATVRNAQARVERFGRRAQHRTAAAAPRMLNLTAHPGTAAHQIGISARPSVPAAQSASHIPVRHATSSQTWGTAAR